MNKSTRIDIPSSSSPSLASADGELHEDDIFAIDITHAPRPSPHPPARQLQRNKSSLKNVEASGILAALPEPSGNSYLNHVFHHKPASVLSTSVSSTASSSSSSGGGASSSSARTIPAAPKPPQERIPFTSSLGKFPQSAPVQVPSAMVNRHKKEFKLTDVVDDDDEEDEEEGEMLPPHEIVARSLAQSSYLSCSVLEGAGRTLKGRDLRQVRNAVFRRTGFID
ncbi:hypothetical protein Bca52824_020950 [Brassica carinata]|uniref:Senescence regulator n=1 Tax=Brassica carinata TaxID=52824 RepID=A0A8X8B134_BRACI|nr:hypothetical protein Bca52824_020950 [Brassica carinata]